LVGQLDDAVGHGELNAGPHLLGAVFAQQEQNRPAMSYPAGQVVERPPKFAFVDEVAQHLGAVYHHERRLLVHGLADHLGYQWLQPVATLVLQQITDMDVLDLAAEGVRFEDRCCDDRLNSPTRVDERVDHGSG
jgi:hypothetical protein